MTATSATVPTLDRKSNEDVFYGEGKAQQIASTISDNVAAVTAKLEMTAEQSANLSRKTSEALQGVGFSEQDADAYMSVLRQAVVSPPDDDQREQWRYETMLAANKEYGITEARRRINKVNSYIRATPVLAEHMKTGAGSHPKIVAMLLERADQLRLERK